MKKWLFLLALPLLVYTCQEDLNICFDASLIDSHIECSTAYEPVCGCDGNTYLNASIAQYQAGLLAWEEGACETQCTYTDTVNVLSDDTSCIILQNLNNDLLELVEIVPNFVIETGQKLAISYTEVDYESSCMVGPTIRIDCLVEMLIDNGCQEIIEAGEDDDQLPNDSLTINSAHLIDDCIQIDYTYMGGCELHKVKLFNLTSIAESEALPQLEIRHDANEDPCIDIVHNEIQEFDLTTLQIEGSHQIHISVICNGDSSFTYEFDYVY
jgi:hypothetical protein